MRELERIHRWRDAQLDAHFDPRPVTPEKDEDDEYERGVERMMDQWEEKETSK